MLDIRYAPPAGIEDRLLQTYRICNRLFITFETLPELSAFRVNASRAVNGESSVNPPPLSTDSKLVYRGPGWITNRMASVQCLRLPSGYQLTVEGIGTFHIGSLGDAITLLETEPDYPPAFLREVVLGPALILALALQGTWCLHASAIVAGSRVVAFVGESGQGKSTLASFLGAESGSPWKRAADDILPVTTGPKAIDTLPHFPQLKLSAENQPSLGLPERLSLYAVYILTDRNGTLDAPISRLLNPREGALALVRHTVAARLFDERLLAKHLSFCGQAATVVPIRFLSYPRDYSSLSKIKEVVTEDLHSLNEDL